MGPTDDGRLQASFCLAGAALYPAWGLLCQVLLPGSVNDLAGRGVVAALWLTIAAAIAWKPAVARHAEAWLAAACAVLIGHYNYLVVLNGTSAFYLTGIFIILGAADALFQRPKPLIAFSALALLSAVPVAVQAGRADPLGVVLLAGLAMQQGLFLAAQRQRAALERELLAKNERLAELDRLKGELIGSVSHELRTPLHAIRAYTELLGEELDGTLHPDQATYLRRITESAGRLQGQIDDLLDVARLEGGSLHMRFEAMDPLELVSAVTGTLAPQAKAKGVELVIDVPKDLPAIVADEERVDQVALNLVGNALKFTPAGGRVLLKLRVEGSYLRVEVRDDGPGIAPAEQALIFEKFYQSTAGDARHRGGAGLGLAIARGIVDAHKGRLGVESVLGQGATFWFTLPVRGPA